MNKTGVALLAVAAVAVVAGAVATKGSPGGIAWTTAPVLAGVAPLALARSGRREVRYAALAFATTATVLLAAVYLAWCVGLGLTGGGPSTSILAFVFAPVYSLAAASLVSIVATAVAAVLEFRTRRRPPGA